MSPIVAVSRQSQLLGAREQNQLDCPTIRDLVAVIILRRDPLVLKAVRQPHTDNPVQS